MEGKAPAAAHNPWVLLDRRPEQARAAEAGGRDLKFELDDPPLRSAVKIRRGLLPSGCDDAYVAAVEPTGRFVVCATEKQASHGAATLQQRLFFCNGTDGTARQLPAIADVAALHPGNIGIVAAPNGHYLVAGLHGDGADQAAMLYCYSTTNSDGEGWMQMPVNDYPPDAHRPWRGTTVIAHDSKLLWVDVSTGILYWDPFTENSLLLHISVPKKLSSNLPGAPAAPHKRGCMQISRGKIRFVALEGRNTDSAVIKSWTLDHIGQAGWKEGYELPVAQVHGSHALSKGLLDLEFIHPYERNVVFITMCGHLIAVNLTTAEVVTSDKSTNKNLDSLVLSLNQRPWTIITSPVRVEASGSLPRGFDLQTYGDVSRITYLRLDQGLLKGFTISHAYVSCVHPTGAMVICVGYQRLKKKKGQAVINTFFVAEGTRFHRLPILSSDVSHHGTAGLSVNSKGMLCAAVLQQQEAAGHATIYYWTSAAAEHKWQRVKANMPHNIMWNGDGVISEGSLLYWCDLTHSCALLSTNPFLAGDKLNFLPLPHDCQRSQKDSMSTVNFSSGLVRLSVLDGPENTPSLKRWTLTAENSWRLDFKLDISTVWNSRSYIAAGLRRPQITFLLLTNPRKPNVMYFMQEQKLIAVTSSGEVSEVQDFLLRAAPTPGSSALVHWSETSIKTLHLLPAP